MSNPQFSHLVLKPSLSCTARCDTCFSRKILYQQKNKEDILTIYHWKKLFQEVNELGLKQLTISGGEPTLYKDLLNLIKEGKSYGWEIGLNTNGSLITEDFVQEMVTAGLHRVSISLYSATPEFHDKIRNHRGLWQKAVKATTIFRELAQHSDPSFRVGMQTILCQGNFRQFPDLVRLAYNIGFCSITFSYLEGDFNERKHLLKREEIKEFKDQILPRAIRVIEKHSPDPLTKKMAIAAAKSIYNEDTVTIDDYAEGIYRRAVPCTIPAYFSIILANGDVYPCNMVEYTHHPVMGNLKERSFSQMWRGKEWQTFRKEGFDQCRFCPVPQQVVIPISRQPQFVRLQYLAKYTPLKKFLPRLKKMAFSSKAIIRRLSR